MGTINYNPGDYGIGTLGKSILDVQQMQQNERAIRLREREDRRQEWESILRYDESKLRTESEKERLFALKQQTARMAAFDQTVESLVPSALAEYSDKFNKVNHAYSQQKFLTAQLLLDDLGNTINNSADRANPDIHQAVTQRVLRDNPGLMQGITRLQSVLRNPVGTKVNQYSVDAKGNTVITGKKIAFDDAMRIARDPSEAGIAQLNGLLRDYGTVGDAEFIEERLNRGTNPLAPAAVYDASIGMFVGGDKAKKYAAVRLVRLETETRFEQEKQMLKQNYMAQGKGEAEAEALALQSQGFMSTQRMYQQHEAENIAMSHYKTDKPGVGILRTSALSGISPDDVEYIRALRKQRDAQTITNPLKAELDYQAGLVSRNLAEGEEARADAEARLNTYERLWNLQDAMMINSGNAGDQFTQWYAKTYLRPSAKKVMRGEISDPIPERKEAFPEWLETIPSEKAKNLRLAMKANESRVMLQADLGDQAAQVSRYPGISSIREALIAHTDEDKVDSFIPNSSGGIDALNKIGSTASSGREFNMMLEGARDYISSKEKRTELNARWGRFGAPKLSFPEIRSGFKKLTQIGANSGAYIEGEKIAQALYEIDSQTDPVKQEALFEQYKPLLSKVALDKNLRDRSPEEERKFKQYKTAEIERLKQKTKALLSIAGMNDDFFDFVIEGKTGTNQSPEETLLAKARIEGVDFSSDAGTKLFAGIMNIPMSSPASVADRASSSVSGASMNESQKRDHLMSLYSSGKQEEAKRLATEWGIPFKE